MQLKFIEDTQNILSLKDALLELTNRNKLMPGLGLIYGPPGLGKTQAVKWYSTQFDCPRLRALAHWTPRDMLQEICVELGQDPEYHTAKVFKQVKDELQRNRRLFFIDEADKLTSNWKLLETLRDLHDVTGTSFVLVGMAKIMGRLAQLQQFWSRISQVVEFKPLKAQEVTYIAYELAGLNLSDEVAAQLTKSTAGYFRDVMVALSHLERIAQANQDKPISKQMIDMTARNVLKQRAA